MNSFETSVVSTSPVISENSAMPTVSSGMNNAGNDTAAFNQNVAVSQPVTSMESEGQVSTTTSITSTPGNDLVIPSSPSVTSVSSQPRSAPAQTIAYSQQGTVTTSYVRPVNSISTSPHSSVSAAISTVSSPATPGSWSSSIHQASSNSPGAASSTTSGSALARARLQELVKEVDSNEQLDEEVEDALLSTADMFIDSVVDSACRLAKHRGSSCLEASDLQFVLEHQWGMWLPGFGAEIKPYKKSASAEAHKQRMAIIRKTLKK